MFSPAQEQLFIRFLRMRSCRAVFCPLLWLFHCPLYAALRCTAPECPIAAFVRADQIRILLRQAPELCQQFRVIGINAGSIFGFVIQDDGLSFIRGQSHSDQIPLQLGSAHRSEQRHTAAAPITPPTTTPIPRKIHFILFSPFRNQVCILFFRHRRRAGRWHHRSFRFSPNNSPSVGYAHLSEVRPQRAL